MRLIGGHHQTPGLIRVPRHELPSRCQGQILAIGRLATVAMTASQKFKGKGLGGRFMPLSHDGDPVSKRLQIVWNRLHTCKHPTVIRMGSVANRI